MVVEQGLFDTNILIDALRGHPAARRTIRLYELKCISIVNWMEVLAGASQAREPYTRTFLAYFQLLPITQQIAEQAVLLRKSTCLKLPDALILATAQLHHLTLVTRNTRDFTPGTPGVHIPYNL